MAVHPPDSVESGWTNLLVEEPPDESIPNRGPKQQPVAAGISGEEHVDSVADGRVDRRIADGHRRVDRRAGPRQSGGRAGVVGAGRGREEAPGPAAGAVRWHGTQTGSVRLSDRKIRIRKPQLREKKGSEPGREVEFRPTRPSTPAADSASGCWSS